MYERFTDRARTVCRLAQQEAIRFNHEYIGTEHLLLGLLKEGSGVAATVLKDMGIDLTQLRNTIASIIKPGPEILTMGKLPHTPRARAVIEHSIEEASNLNHNYVGTEHLLLGLVRETEGAAAEALKQLGLTAEKIREEVLWLLKGEEKTEALTVAADERLLAVVITLPIGHSPSAALAESMQGLFGGAPVLMLPYGYDIALVKEKIAGAKTEPPAQEQVGTWSTKVELPAELAEPKEETWRDRPAML